MEELLRTFSVVAEQRSFNRAASVLHLTPAAVRKRIDALESLFETELFDRGKAGLRILPAGASLLEDVPGILTEIAGARQRAQCASDISNSVTMGFYRSEMFNLLQPVLAKMKELPQLQIEYIGTNITAGANPEVMRERGIDILLVSGESSIPNLSFASFCRCRPCLAVPLGNPLSSRDNLTPADLKGQTIVMFERSRSQVLSNAWQWMRTHCEDVYVVCVRDEEYGHKVPNECVRRGHLLLSVDDGACVHPAMRNIPVAWPFATEYCLAYPTLAPYHVKRFCLDVHAKSVELGLLRTR